MDSRHVPVTASCRNLPFRYLIATLCALLLLAGCAQFYGRHARRGTEVVVLTEGPTPIAYQILLSPAGTPKNVSTGFNSQQPILQTSDSPFVFAVGHFLIRQRCGRIYKDTEVQFRRGTTPQVVKLSC